MVASCEEHRMQNENKYEMLKSAYDFLNEQMSAFEQTVEMETAEYHLLKALGEYTEASKTQLTRYHHEIYSLMNEWKKGEDYRMVEEKIFMSDKNWTAMFQQKKSIYIKDVEHIPEQLKKVETEMKKEGIQSLFSFPMFDDNKLIAIITICNPSEAKIGAIEEIHEILGNWLGYRLVKNDNRVQKTLSGLGVDYTAAYMINIDTDYFEVIINQKPNNSAKQKKEQKFTDYLNKYADKYTLEWCREAMKKELCIDTLRKRFEKEKEFHFSFETTPNEVGQSNFQAHAVREYGEDGHYAIVGFRCIDDILQKERKYQEELDKAYKYAQQQLDIITAAIPGGIKISEDDESYSFKYVSEQYAAMLGYDTVEEFMNACGGTIVGIAHPDDLENGIAEALRQYETSDHYEITYRMKCKDGSWKYIEDHGHKVYMSDGKVEHWNLILDKNELVEKTIALESEKKANAAKTDFLSRMSHDIRTPLNGIIGLLEIGQKHPDDFELINKNREKARIAADHLLSLINDVLELNKLGDRDVMLVEEAFPVRELIQEVKTITEMRAEEEEIELKGKIDYDQLNYPYILGSPLHIKQIFINIITNAIKYNKEHGSVYCHLQEKLLDSKHVKYHVRIEDTGIGMTKEFQKQIFEPFTQAAQDARSVYQGTGLGMPIVKNLVDRMGGTIQIESEPEVGTIVEVSLTFKIAEEQKHQGEKNRPVDKIRLAGTKVLLVEDNDLNRDIAKFILEDEKMFVTEAENGQQAMDLFENSPVGMFDIILMDIMMPVKDGLETAREIRKLDRIDAKTIPIFAMTANAFSEDRKKTKEAGMNEHISKPLDIDALMQKISEYCKK